MQNIHTPKTILREKTLRFEDIEEAHGFTQISNLALLDKAITAEQFRLLMILKNHGWSRKGIFPGQDKLAQELGCKRRQINNLLQGLKEAGYITWERRGLTKTNIYTILKKQWNHTPVDSAIFE